MCLGPYKLSSNYRLFVNTRHKLSDLFKAVNSKTGFNAFELIVKEALQNLCVSVTKLSEF